MGNYLPAARVELLLREVAGHVFRITFVKGDGTRRVMRARLPVPRDSIYGHDPEVAAIQAAVGVVLLFCLDCYEKQSYTGLGHIAAGRLSWRNVSLHRVEDITVLF